MPHLNHLKLSFRRFNGDDPAGWLYRAEQYFEFNNVQNDPCVCLASFRLEGLAFQWHRWFTKVKGPIAWEVFTKAILVRFGPTDFEDPSEALIRL